MSKFPSAAFDRWLTTDYEGERAAKQDEDRNTRIKQMMHNTQEGDLLEAFVEFVDHDKLLNAFLRNDAFTVHAELRRGIEKYWDFVVGDLP